MIHLITPERYDDFRDHLADMHRLRYRVFKERLGWDVQVNGEMEKDRFDDLGPVYLIQFDSVSRLCGCVRLLPTTGPNMLREIFAELLDGRPAPATPDIWESSRFAIDSSATAPKREAGIGNATMELFAGMVELGLSRQLTSIVTVTDVRMERILRRAAWPLLRLAPPKTIGSTQAVTGFLEVSSESLNRLREAGSLKGPVLWEPVNLRAA